jgi:hypothetical protein
MAKRCERRDITEAFIDAAEAGAYRLKPRRESAAGVGGAQRHQRVLAMARRRASKARSDSASAGARVPRQKAKAGAAALTLVQRLAVLERERDALKEELERSKARVRQLEDGQAQVRDRIAWALDSLHNILDGKA